MDNPYQTPGVDVKPRIVAGTNPKVVRKPLSLYLLSGAFLATGVMALVNLYQEDPAGEVPSVRLLFINCLIAGFSTLSQAPGLFVAAWRWKGSPNRVLPMLWAAYIVACTGVGAFALFVWQSEPSDSMNSAAHMHIFLFPAIHLVFAGAIYLVGLLVTAAVVVYVRLAQRRRAEQREQQDISSGDVIGRLND